MEFIEIVGDCVAVKVEAFGNEAVFCTLVAHANDEKFNFGLLGVGRVINCLVEVLDILVGKMNFNHCLSQA